MVNAFNRALKYQIQKKKICSFPLSPPLAFIVLLGKRGKIKQGGRGRKNKISFFNAHHHIPKRKREKKNTIVYPIKRKKIFKYLRLIKISLCQKQKTKINPAFTFVLLSCFFFLFIFLFYRQIVQPCACTRS